MKRVILMLAVIVSVAISSFGQSANRKGFFIEAQGGAALGEVFTFKDDGQPYLKGGATGMLDFGYRFRTSQHFAFEFKLGGYAIFDDFSKTYNLHLMPGIRWTSGDFGGMSAYLSLNTGYGMAIDGIGVIPCEFGAGINLTRKLYLGVSYTEMIAVGNSGIKISLHSSDMRYRKWIEPNNYGCFQVKLGYRF